MSENGTFATKVMQKKRYVYPDRCILFFVLWCTSVAQLRPNRWARASVTWLPEIPGPAGNRFSLWNSQSWPFHAASEGVIRKMISCHLRVPDARRSFVSIIIATKRCYASFVDIIRSNDYPAQLYRGSTRRQICPSVPALYAGAERSISFL